ncbi:hypothetical protein CDD83_8581 [Cordyceps sp. RAO-2017]|nr:hypothetical protein CDD83_8581 [Cordyceps sp. RAO-2017]
MRGGRAGPTEGLGKAPTSLYRYLQYDGGEGTEREVQEGVQKYRRDTHGWQSAPECAQGHETLGQAGPSEAGQPSSGLPWPRGPGLHSAWRRRHSTDTAQHPDDAAPPPGLLLVQLVQRAAASATRPTGAPPGPCEPTTALCVSPLCASASGTRYFGRVAPLSLPCGPRAARAQVESTYLPTGTTTTTTTTTTNQQPANHRGRRRDSTGSYISQNGKPDPRIGTRQRAGKHLSLGVVRRD